MLVGVTGYAQHGKDTIGQLLVAEYGFKRYAFADKLKELALLLNPIVRTYQFPKHPERLQPLVKMLGWEAAKQNAEVRRFLQELGTRLRETIGEDVWVDALDLQLRDECEWGWNETGTSGDPSKLLTDVVITDVRFPNEAAYIHRGAGILVRAERVTEDGEPYDNGLGTEHPSEAHVADLPVDVILEAKNVSDLQDGVRAMMELIREGVYPGV